MQNAKTEVVWRCRVEVLAFGALIQFNLVSNRISPAIRFALGGARLTQLHRAISTTRLVSRVGHCRFQGRGFQTRQKV